MLQATLAPLLGLPRCYIIIVILKCIILNSLVAINVVDSHPENEVAIWGYYLLFPLLRVGIA